MKPTEEQYAVYQNLFDYLNDMLFDNELPVCMLTFSDKGKKSEGYFSGQSWVKAGQVVHEISLNPEYVKSHSLKQTMALLAHQMVHLWQEEKGHPSRKSYHNRQWSGKMRAIGLVASDTGEKGGRETGQKMSQYVKVGGRFEAAYEAMGHKKEIPFQAQYEGEGVSAGQGEREKYSCAGCGVNIWGKERLKVVCGECGEMFESAGGKTTVEIKEGVYKVMKAKYGG